VSAYRVHESAIRDHEGLIEAFCDRAKQLALQHGKNEAQAEEAAAQVRDGIVVSLNESVQLRGYKGDLRKERAHVVVPQQIVNTYLGGGASNDVGFLRQQDGTYSAVVSAYDQSAWWDRQADRFHSVAMVAELERAAMAEGRYDLKRVECDTHIELKCVAFR
jgi:hypothetical protein